MLAIARALSPVVLLALAALLPASAARAEENGTNPDGGEAAAVPHDEATQQLDLRWERLADAIEDRLQRSRSIRGHRIDVDVVDGVAVLSGGVDALLGKRRAVDIATRTQGVVGVVDQIVVRPRTREDRRLQFDLRRALRYDPAVERYEVRTTVNGGRVTLEGRVDSEAERKLAETVVAGVRGVRQVENLLEVDPVRIPGDDEIATAIRRGLTASPLVDAQDVQVHVEDGTVRLEGTVPDAAAETRAVRWAWWAGARRVDTEALTVRPQDGPDADEAPARETPTLESMERAAERVLSYDPRVRMPDDLSIRIDHGIARIEGTVPDLRSRLVAAEDVSNIAGVLAVENRLRVRPDLEIDDATIEKAIRAAYERDAHLSRHDLAVDVEDGHVYLAGRVEDAWERRRALHLAAAAAGVVHVFSDLAMPGGHTPPDARLEAEVKEAFSWDGPLHRAGIEVSVLDGVVTLEGTVPHPSLAAEAREIARALGARRVVSRLDVE